MCTIADTKDMAGDASSATLDSGELKCPRCDCEAIYKYGKTKTGKQRFLCIVCGRQFTLEARKRHTEERPSCPVCGKKMHLYMTKGATVRYRCSEYPSCKTFYKVKKEEVI